MKRSQTLPDNYTFPSLIKSCSNSPSIPHALSIHAQCLVSGFLHDLFVQTGLIELYGKCKEIRYARKVFDEMRIQNEVSWTAMLSSYLNVWDLRNASKMFDEMPFKNVGTWNAMMGGFAGVGDLVTAKRMFDEMPERNVVSFTVMVDGYAKSGDMASARAIFDGSPDNDVVSWSALIAGYAQNGHPNESVSLFFDMCGKNVKPDEFVLSSVMSACSQVGSLDLAKWVDSYVAHSDLDLRRAHVVSGLIDMNAKCGNMDKAKRLFESMPRRDLISYCSMIQGLSMHGHEFEAVELFGRMLNDGIAPDHTAFTVVLSACSHAGLVDEGCYYFDKMRNLYSMVPSPDHYSCMVDLFGRSGRLKEAYELLKGMPIEPHAGAWGALLGACKLNCDIGLAEEVTRRLFKLEPFNAANYVVLSNIYAALDRWLDVSNLRSEMKERGLKKIPGWSCL